MKYVSTRGQAAALDFGDTLLAGLASDGGLYVPDTWPALPGADQLDACDSYAATAAAVCLPFVGDDVDAADLDAMSRDAYATFRHEAVVPLVQIGDDRWIAELFHGPTLAFKDVALQLVGRLFDHVLGRRGERVTVVGATSGDTGPAAIEGVRTSDHVDIVMLYPRGGTSDVQRRQMTTVDAANVRAVAIDGTFDDCQDLVKAMFNDVAFRDRLNLTAANSINWARVMAQTVYFVTVARALRGPITASVPTGNFGNIFAGWVAQRMGAPIADFIVASNANDILTRFVNDGDMSIRPVVADDESVDGYPGVVELRAPAVRDQRARRFAHRRAALPLSSVGTPRAANGPARAVDRRSLPCGPVRRRRSGRRDAPCVRGERDAHRPAHGDGNGGRPPARRASIRWSRWATAHPAKFPDAVEAATGVRPELPDHLADLLERPERTETLPNDLAAVEDYVLAAFG